MAKKYQLHGAFPSKAGDSAYQVALNNGFKGTEQEWLTSLVGPQGPQGQPGQDGQDDVSGSSIHIGPEPPEDETIDIWINPDGEPDSDGYATKGYVDDKTDEIVNRLNTDEKRVGTHIPFIETAQPGQHLIVREVDDNGKPTSWDVVDGYTLPVATPDTLGGVQPVPKTDEMTHPVGVDELGGLWSAGGGGGSYEWKLDGELETTEEVSEIRLDVSGLPDTTCRFGLRFVVYIPPPAESYTESFIAKIGNATIFGGPATSNTNNLALYVTELHGICGRAQGWTAVQGAGLSNNLRHIYAIQLGIADTQLKLITDGGNNFPKGTRVVIERYVKEA